MRRVGVVGCGHMGAGIAEAAAVNGADVVIVKSSEEAARAGLDRLNNSLTRAENAILAPNASSIPIVKLGAATSRPQQVWASTSSTPFPVPAQKTTLPLDSEYKPFNTGQAKTMLNARWRDL